MISDALYSPEPADGAAAELNELLTRRDRLNEQASEAEQRTRFGTTAVEDAREALVALERRAASGGKVTASERRGAEAELSRAHETAREPRGERARARRLAVGDIDRELGMFVSEHFDELQAALEQEAQAVKQRCDAACAELLAAFAAREQVAVRLNALAAAIRPPRPGDIRASRMEGVAREAARLIETEGGEAAPVLRVDPRRPRHAAPPIPALPEAF